MNPFLHSRIAAVLAAPLMLASPFAVAQTVFVQPATPDADALAEQIRQLATNPTDVNAMIRAGELTLKLNDGTAAAGFFARAERIDPNNPRIKAGKAILLVQAGRPGEALRMFAEAEVLRGDVQTFAAERGLAYDLIGEQERAQRDYRLSLRYRPDDETVRRYALSLGISGKKDEALETIDALVRRSDRGAWRARAFILAMNGDSRGAERIAASMMPGGLGQGLQPFFDRLPKLGPVDRAFAVHFGEVRSSPQRIADARMTPRLPALQPEAGRPVAVAAVAPLPVQHVAAKDDRKAKKDRNKRGKDSRDDRVVVAAAPAPVPLPPPPEYQGQALAAIAQTTAPAYNPPPAASGAPVFVQSIPQRPSAQAFADATPRTEPRLPPVVLASNRATISALPAPRPTQERVVPAADVPVRAITPTASDTRPAMTAQSSAPLEFAAPIPKATEPNTVPSVAAQLPSTSSEVKPAFVTPAPSLSIVPDPAANKAGRSSSVSSSVATTLPEPAEAKVAAVAAPTRLPPVPGPVKGEDSILATIIANIVVPASELEGEGAATAALDGGEPETPATPVEATPVPVVAASTAPDSEAVQATLIAQQKAADKQANDRKIADATKAAEARKEAEVKKLAEEKKLAEDKKVADAKKLAETKKAAETKKLADAKKAEELKKKNDPKLLEPSRIWVQVAGGANEGTLGKEWARVREKAPVAFKGRSGWTTPLRATNRVLTGPFKTDAEARSFVNALAKEGISAFTFTSDAGQKVARLGVK